MAVVYAHITVSPDGSISGRVSAGELPSGEHEVAILVTTAPIRPSAGKPFTMADFPVHDVPWDGSISLRREDLYDDEGQLV
jgi:hypothetical protein